MRIHEHPLITFTDGPAGRRARLAGGPDVWEVIGAIRSVREAEPALAGEEVLAVVAETSGSPVPFIRAAVAYWSDYPEEVDDFLDRAREQAAQARAAWERQQGLLGIVTGAAGGVPDALLLDEMFSPAIAADLTTRGIDCRTIVADPVLRALSDLEIFQTALAKERVIATANVTDFESLRREQEAAGNEVPGLIYTSDFAFPRTKAYVSRLAAALAAAAAGHETARRGGVLWLRPPA